MNLMKKMKTPLQDERINSENYFSCANDHADRQEENDEDVYEQDGNSGDESNTHFELNCGKLKLLNNEV
ncbi:hypothetical protein HCN44_003480 [Aphidius gifuensis]|uniref:Uncharacterized protein n=1 Tax=Aphidius gifuensis TaxID=684658 RepID=A0A835CKV7_APHGI|nr:hypothetical protein HCN44_003480 [Aphidius gifuensis]